MLKTLFIIISMLITCLSSEAGVLKDCLQSSYGGSYFLDKGTEIILHGKITDFVRGKEGFCTVYLRKGDKMRYEAFVTQSTSGEIIVLNGKKGWKNRGKEFVAVSNEENKALKALYIAFYSPFSLINADKNLVYEQRYITRGSFFSLYTLKEAGMPDMAIYINPASMLVQKMEWHDEKDFDSSIAFDDFRTTGGVLLPHKLTRYAGDIKLQAIEFDKIELGSMSPDSIFWQ